MIDDLLDIDEAPVIEDEIVDIEEPQEQAQEESEAPIDLADELDIDLDIEAPLSQEQAEDVQEEAPQQEEQEAIVEPQEEARQEEQAQEEQPQEEPQEEAPSTEDVDITSNQGVEDLVSSIYQPIEEEEQPQQEPQEAQEAKPQETKPTAPRGGRKAIGGEPLPEGLYEEVPQEEQAQEEQPQEEQQEEQQEAPQEELSEDEKALREMMKEAEDEDKKDQEAEANLDNKRIELDAVMNDPRFAAYTTFEKKLIAATDRQRKYYSDIKNTFLLYSRVSTKIANPGESIRQGSKLIARITLNNDKLRLHLCLEPNAYNPRQYHHYSMAKYAAYSDVPFTLDIEDAASLDIALQLIREAMSTKFLFAPNKKWQEEDYAAPYTLDDKGNLPPKTE